MDENRLIDIETKLAHQERLLEDLEGVVTDQQGRLTELETLCRQLVDRLRGMAEQGAAPTLDERPPHY